MPSALKIDQTEKTLTFVQRLDARRQLVFEAFTKPEHLKRWWTPKQWPVQECSVDLRPGGEWRYFIANAEGERHYAKAVYEQVEAPERLVFVDYFTHEDGTPIEGLPRKRVTVTFAEAAGATDLKVHVELKTTDELQKLVKMQFVPGFTAALGNLTELLSDLQIRS